MKLAQLKQQAHESWETLNLIDGAITPPDDHAIAVAFLQRLSGYGARVEMAPILTAS